MLFFPESVKRHKFDTDARLLAQNYPRCRICAHIERMTYRASAVGWYLQIFDRTSGVGAGAAAVVHEECLPAPSTIRNVIERQRAVRGSVTDD